MELAITTVPTLKMLVLNVRVGIQRFIIPITLGPIISVVDYFLLGSIQEHMMSSSAAMTMIHHVSSSLALP